MSVWRDYGQAWPALKAHKILRIQQNRLHPIAVTLLNGSPRQVTVLGLAENFIKIPLVCKGGGCKALQVCVSRCPILYEAKGYWWRCDGLLQFVTPPPSFYKECRSHVAHGPPWGEHLGLVPKTGSQFKHTHPRLRYPSRWCQMLRFRVGWRPPPISRRAWRGRGRGGCSMYMVLPFYSPHTPFLVRTTYRCVNKVYFLMHTYN